MSQPAEGAELAVKRRTSGSESGADAVKLRLEEEEEAEDVDADDMPRYVVKRRSAVFVLLYLSVFIDFMGTSIVVPAIPYLGRQLGASSFEIGLLFSAYALAQAVSNVTFGRLSDTCVLLRAGPRARRPLSLQLARARGDPALPLVRPGRDAPRWPTLSTANVPPLLVRPCPGGRLLTLDAPAGSAEGGSYCSAFSAAASAFWRRHLRPPT